MARFSLDSMKFVLVFQWTHLDKNWKIILNQKKGGLKKKCFEISFCSFNHSLFCSLTSINESDGNISIMRDSDSIINFHSAPTYRKGNSTNLVSA